MKIGVISDTHGSLEAKFLDFFKDCDQIWHAGDIGDWELVEKLKTIAEVKAVFGNIDGRSVRAQIPEYQIFIAGGKRILMIHIGGYPGKYQPKLRALIHQYHPDIYVCGHSHILKVIYDHQYQLLHINPGAAGNNGFHKIKTAIRFDIQNDTIENLQILEVDRKK